MVDFDMPIEIIHHIQSFLDDGNEANRTCILSKSWYEAWSTRPILFFRINLPTQQWDSILVGDWDWYSNEIPDVQWDSNEIPAVETTANEEHAEILDSFGRIINRYKEHNLPLQKLILHLVNGSSSLTDELIVGATTLGITELDLKFMTNSTYFPVQVFHITSLLHLSIRGDQYPTYPYQRIRIDRVLCSGIVSLKLYKVDIDYHVIRHVLLGCPLIQILVLNNVSSTIDDDKSASNDNRVLCPSLVSLQLDRCDSGSQRSIQDILSGCPLIEKLELSFDNILLPAQVWTATSFKSLSFKNYCRIQIDNDTTICSRLVSLSFHKSTRIDDDVIRHILLRCPLIENLHLEEPQGLSCINVSEMHNLVNLSIRCRHWENHINVSFESISSGSDVPEFKKLRLLSLEYVKVDDEFFNEFSTRFPCIEDVALSFSDGYEEIRISSRSVRYLKLHHCGTLEKAEFNVPNIHRFEYDGDKGIPLLSFHTGSSDWVSKVKLRFPSSQKVIDICWFVKLREFLNELSHSRISLSIDDADTDNLIWVKDFPSSPTPVVDNLIILYNCSSFENRAYLCGLFGCFRPTLITFEMCPGHSSTFRFAQILHEILLYQDTKRISRVQSSLMYDLEEIYIELYEKTEWQTIPLTKFVEDGPTSSLYEDVRFRFKWGAFKCT